MNIETCKKYLEFVYSECEQFLEDRRVTDDELNQLIIEFHRFRDQAAESGLPEEIKDRLSKLHIDYPRIYIKRGYGYMFSVVLSLGLWAFRSGYRKQRRRWRVLETL